MLLLDQVRSLCNEKGETSHDRHRGGSCNNENTNCCLPAMVCDEVQNQTVEIFTVFSEYHWTRVRICWASFCHAYRTTPANTVHMSSVPLKDTRSRCFPVQEIDPVISSRWGVHTESTPAGTKVSHVFRQHVVTPKGELLKA